MTVKLIVYVMWKFHWSKTLATYTSSQSGNFSAAATVNWLRPPGDGDDFNVASGHTVTIDSGISQPTNGYHDSYIYGVLKTTRLRILSFA